jgi:hypothetical protein
LTFPIVLSSVGVILRDRLPAGMPALPGTKYQFIYFTE